MPHQNQLGRILLWDPKDMTDKAFTFSHVFGQQSTNREVGLDPLSKHRYVVDLLLLWPCHMTYAFIIFGAGV